MAVEIFGFAQGAELLLLRAGRPVDAPPDVEEEGGVGGHQELHTGLSPSIYWDRVCFSFVGWGALLLLRLMVKQKYRHKLSSLVILLFFLALGASFVGILAAAAGAWMPPSLEKANYPQPSYHTLADNLLLPRRVTFEEFRRVLSIGEEGGREGGREEGAISVGVGITISSSCRFLTHSPSSLPPFLPFPLSQSTPPSSGSSKAPTSARSSSTPFTPSLVAPFLLSPPRPVFIPSSLSWRLLLLLLLIFEKTKRSSSVTLTLPPRLGMLVRYGPSPFLPPSLPFLGWPNHCYILAKTYAPPSLPPSPNRNHGRRSHQCPLLL